MLSVYFDESGTHADPKVFSLGGYLFTEKRLIRFEPEWLSTLRRFHVSAFHASDLETQKGEFAGWSADDCDRLLSELTGIINRRAVLGVGVVADARAFARYATRIPSSIGSAYQKVLARNPYALCLFRCLEFVAEYQKDRDHSQEKIACICDKTDFEGTLRDVYERAKRAVPWGAQFGTITFASDEVVVPLQAADLLAYMLRRGTMDLMLRRPNSLRKGYRRLRASMYRTEILDRTSVRILGEQLDALLAPGV